MKTNIATTSEQSERLLRCGVSADTADMCWHGTIVPRGGSLTSMPEPSEEWDLWATPYSCMPEEMQADKLMEDYTEIIPAWSLSALMTKILPSNIRYEGHTSLLEITSSNWQSDEQIWEVAYDIDLGVEASDPIEACVLMAEKLTANGYKMNEQ